MNERIEQLAEQAGAKIHKEQTRSGDWVDFSNYAGFDHEKFAELIIRECADAIREDAKRFPVTDVTWTCAMAESANVVMRHFGVEE